MVQKFDSILTRQRLVPANNHWNWHIPTPLSQGWKVGPMVFVGGQLSADEYGNVLGGSDIEVQTENVFRNIGNVLACAGATWKDVVKLNTYYVFEGEGAEIQDYWEKMTRVRMRYISEPGPAATAVRVAGLMYDGFLIEAEAIAIVGGEIASIDTSST